MYERTHEAAGVLNELVLAGENLVTPRQVGDVLDCDPEFLHEFSDAADGSVSDASPETVFRRLPTELLGGDAYVRWPLIVRWKRNTSSSSSVEQSYLQHFT